MVWRWDSDPFGASEPDPDGDAIDHVVLLRFPGQYADAESGRYYNYFRDYDPGTGRYAEPDPSGLYGGSNRFSYASQNPVSKFDPNGLIWVTVDIDYHGGKNWLYFLLQRIASLEEGKFPSAYDCANCTRDVIQEWQPRPEDAEFGPCPPPKPGDRRKIKQTFNEYPDNWSTSGKSWHWSPPVPSPTYQEF